MGISPRKILSVRKIPKALIEDRICNGLACS
jgi:hypothetical protein